MTENEAIKYLIRPVQTSTVASDEYTKQIEAYRMAIDALEQKAKKKRGIRIVAPWGHRLRHRVAWAIRSLQFHPECKRGCIRLRLRTHYEPHQPQLLRLHHIFEDREIGCGCRIGYGKKYGYKE